MARTKKVGITGRFGARYGRKAKRQVKKIEENMKKKHVCPKCDSELITKIDRMNGYLGYTRIHGDTRYNEAKNAELKDRVSM